RRMMTPRLSTTTVIVRSEKQELPIAEPVEKGTFPTTGKQVVALIPDEIFAECPHKELAGFVRNRLGAELGPCLRINQPEDNQKQVLNEIRQSITPDTDALMILQEAWQPPIEEFFAFRSQLRKTGGKKILISIMLIGKPTPETIFTKVRKQDYAIWRQKIISRGDPYLQSIPLVDA
ncbi:MAG TPA: DUF2868 domain-containing protein, partial [Desulfobulbaceae bacterium]|nr:DUF2868 domain-containing protein [Desulfobulbaceae bacterium]